MKNLILSGILSSISILSNIVGITLSNADSISKNKQAAWPFSAIALWMSVEINEMQSRQDLFF